MAACRSDRFRGPSHVTQPHVHVCVCCARPLAKWPPFRSTTPVLLPSPPGQQSRKVKELRVEEMTSRFVCASGQIRKNKGHGVTSLRWVKCRKF